MNIYVRPGNNLGPNQLDRCIDFLAEAGAVQYFKTAKERLHLALVVATIRDGPYFDLVGMGAIKADLPEYNKKISERSGYSLPFNMREIGYIAVAEAYRGKGYSKQIVKRLLEFDAQVFATTSSEAMMSTFRHFGFKRKGDIWTSKEGKALSLWVKEE